MSEKWVQKLIDLELLAKRCLWLIRTVAFDTMMMTLSESESNDFYQSPDACRRLFGEDGAGGLWFELESSIRALDGFLTDDPAQRHEYEIAVRTHVVDVDDEQQWVPTAPDARPRRLSCRHAFEALEGILRELRIWISDSTLEGDLMIRIDTSLEPDFDRIIPREFWQAPFVALRRQAKRDRRWSELDYSSLREPIAVETIRAKQRVAKVFTGDKHTLAHADGTMNPVATDSAATSNPPVLPKRPIGNEFECFKLQFVLNTQREIAERVYGDEKKQWKVSRDIKAVEKYLTVLGIPDHQWKQETEKPDFVPWEPRMIDLGKRTDPHSLQQREKYEDSD